MLPGTFCEAAPPTVEKFPEIGPAITVRNPSGLRVSATSFQVQPDPSVT